MLLPGAGSRRTRARARVGAGAWQFGLRRKRHVTSLRAMPYQPAPWMMLPFAALLVMIALGPLLFPAWWLRHYPKVAFGLGIITVAYYYIGLPAAARLRVF